MTESPVLPAPDSAVSVLLVEPTTGEFASLQEIFHRSAPPSAGPEWTVCSSPSIRSAALLLRRQNVPIALCDDQATTGRWQELLKVTASLPDPPLLIVTSRLADERLWAEALNLGAQDVLSKPYDRTEVVWVMSAAWRSWQQRHRRGAAVATAGYSMRAAG